MSDELPAAVRGVIADAAAHAVPMRVCARPAASSHAEAAAGLGIPAARLAKTLVVRRSAGDYLFVLVPGDRAIAWPKLRAVAGVNRLSLPDAAEARSATGYERGTITALGSLHPWPVYVDESLAGQHVAVGSGAHGFGVFVEVDDLVSGYGATLADLTAA